MSIQIFAHLKIRLSSCDRLVTILYILWKLVLFQICISILFLPVLVYLFIFLIASLGVYNNFLQNSYNYKNILLILMARVDSILYTHYIVNFIYFLMPGYLKT